MSNSNDKELTITILTPDGTFQETFLKTAKIQDVINAIIQKFNYAQNGRYELQFNNGDDTLEPNRTLVSYHIKDGDQFIFTELGIGV
jgi:capsule polysaccharide modification protein KpsS